MLTPRSIHVVLPLLGFAAGWLFADLVLSPILSPRSADPVPVSVHAEGIVCGQCRTVIGAIISAAQQETGRSPGFCPYCGQPLRLSRQDQ